VPDAPRRRTEPERSIRKPRFPIHQPRTPLSPMTTAAWITMAVIMAFVWGGFVLLLVTALRKESGKRTPPPERRAAGAG
jgi:hypothetical protein